MEQKNEQLQRLRDYLNRTKGQRYPFSGHWLEDEDGYLKNAWLKMLCMVLQGAKDISEEQTLFLQRLAAGIGAEYDVQTYMRQGLEVTPEALEEFIELLLDDTEDDADEKRYAFVLDALLLIHLGEADEDAEELLAQVCEALRFTVGELENITGLCANILRQELPGSILRAWRIVGQYNGFLWSPYLVENCGEVSKTAEDAMIIAQMDPAPLDLSQIGKTDTITFTLSNNNGSCSKAPCIAFRKRSYLYLCGLEITVDQHLYFENIDMVEFEDCIFTSTGEGANSNTDIASICFSDCKDVEFTNCTFQNFRSRTIIALDVPEIHIEDCSFKDCIRMYNRDTDDWKELGGVIYGGTNVTKLYLQSSRFTNCGGHNERVFYASSIISNCRTEIEDCCFQNCWHTYSVSYSGRKDPDPAESRRCLFKHILSESNNEVIDSAELGPH